VPDPPAGEPAPETAPDPEPALTQAPDGSPFEQPTFEEILHLDDDAQ
jgi:hypothetical protein